MNNNFRNLIKSDEYIINILNNKINIINYIDILFISKTKINILLKDKTLLINGKNLILKKIEDKELLIEGIISNIEFR